VYCYKKLNSKQSLDVTNCCSADSLFLFYIFFVHVIAIKIHIYSIGIFLFCDGQCCCNSRSDGGMLQVFYICSLCVLNECGINMAAVLEVCVKQKQCAVLLWWGAGGAKGTEIY
jgi:hypothetical protein